MLALPSTQHSSALDAGSHVQRRHFAQINPVCTPRTQTHSPRRGPSRLCFRLAEAEVEKLQ